MVQDLVQGAANSDTLPPAGAPALFAVPQAATELVEGFVAAFNAHDADRFTGLFTEHAWYTDVVGHQLRGRHEIAKAHSYALTGPLESTHLDVQ